MHRAWIAVCALFFLPRVAEALDAPAGIVAKQVGAGWLFTDRQGLSLYTTVKDKPGQSTCMDECAALWLPVVATDTTVAGDWSIVDRDDGTKQIAHRGLPLYRYVKDPAPGTTFGDGIGKAWRVARQDLETPPGIVIGNGIDGRALTDSRGRKLYVNANDKMAAGPAAAAISACQRQCLDSWKPVPAPMAAVSSGQWSIAIREDGFRQWAFDGKPLYISMGSDRASDPAWAVALVEPPPPAPDWLRYHPSDGGDVAATSEGYTVYALTEKSGGADAPECDADCVRTYWRPLAAAPDAKPTGNWTIVTGFDGQNQWAYKGEKLFTHTRDKAPGDIAGTRFFANAWHTLTPTGQVLEGLDRSGG